MALRGVIFDLDGVLCDSEPFLTEAAIAMFRERHGVSPTPEAFHPFLGAGEDQFLRGVAEQHGVELNWPDDKEVTYQRYFELIRGRLEPMPGAIDMIQACFARGLKIAVATAADSRKLEQNLKEIGLPPDKFHTVVAAHQIQNPKPDPEIYTFTAYQLDLSPTDCLVIEDSPLGVTAAKSAGAHCLGVTTNFDGRTLCQHGADWTAPNLSRLPEAAVCW